MLPTKTRGIKPILTKACRPGIHDGQWIVPPADAPETEQLKRTVAAAPERTTMFLLLQGIEDTPLPGNSSLDHDTIHGPIECQKRYNSIDDDGKNA